MVEFNEDQLKHTEDRLNSAIRSLLYGGGGDPSYRELRNAAICFEVLKILGLKVRGEEDIRRELEGENICEENFLKSI